ncbi:hypothetical protein GOODEAATRI_010858 [Goodea atripinnis]|uniref:DUF4605 domain-containing protein n=1 Tax=Goodea atripinnis TaxID=208336 RepID=A0ABV0NJ64_9TELE
MDRLFHSGQTLRLFAPVSSLRVFEVVARTCRRDLGLQTDPLWRTREAGARRRPSMESSTQSGINVRKVHRTDQCGVIGQVLPYQNNGGWGPGRTVGPSRIRARPPVDAGLHHSREPAVQTPQVDDCEKMGTLFGMINKCLRGVGFTQVYFGDRTVEPVVVLVFWVLLWFLGFQALGLVGTLCIIIIYIQK